TLFDIALVFLQRHAVGANLIEQHAGQRRQCIGRGPLLCGPEVCPAKGLRAVQEALLDFNADRDEWRLPLYGAALEQFRVARDPGAAVDAQRLLTSRHQKEQADMRVPEEIRHAVQTLVAWTIRN